MPEPDLFHGTDAVLEPGTVIVPADPDGPIGYRRYAYATPDPNAARYFGRHVYRVQPVGRYDPPSRMPQYEDEPSMLEVTSIDGFAVVGLHTTDADA